MAFSLIYLLPIMLLSINYETKFVDILFCSTIAAASWSYSEYSSVPFTSLFFAVWNTGVRFITFFTIGTLIFKLKEKDKRIQITNKKLNELNLEKNKFIGIAAHDLANPIGAINSFSELLIESCAENKIDEVREGLDIIKTLSANTMGVLKNLLNVSVIESGKIDLKLRKGDYIQFVKNQITYNQIVAKNKNIIIRFESNLTSSLLIFDEHYLSEVTSNLLSNAIKYSYAGTEIVVKVSQTATALLTEIIDQGKGIPEKEQQQLFFYFQKSSTQPTQGESSTGLGLAIAKQIVILHQGSIGLKSTVGEGSNFYYSLPILS
ncbi:sensor histidine kinase [Flavobacterium algicola]|uniref:sensor histidine kinase n=1 Tax=Flavobacterium algicola TaxID=556529 RepID=UPI001EFDCA91|nr:HAMP domain-containing sensor histidine kinase [Flavobacterium algicola]MCG9792990.1 HAMP domain-containing histidine kinase [Flavobacterium algicola]